MLESMGHLQDRMVSHLGWIVQDLCVVLARRLAPDKDTVLRELSHLHSASHSESRQTGQLVQDSQTPGHRIQDGAVTDQLIQDSLETVPLMQASPKAVSILP